MIIIDLTAHRCPYPLVRTKLMLKQLVPGDKLQLLLSDPGSRQDVPRFLKKQGYHYQILCDDAQLLRLLVG